MDEQEPHPGFVTNDQTASRAWARLGLQSLAEYDAELEEACATEG